MSDPAASRDAVCRAETLVRLFHDDPAEFGRIRSVDVSAVPDVPRRLLDHHSHMTVAMERFHGGPVRLRVIAERATAGHNGYAREIALVSEAGLMVQHGIVRIDMEAVSPATAAVIRAGREPLGHILIGAGLLREVEEVRLVEVEPGTHLRGLVGWPADAGGRTFGRVALIRLDRRPAVELLEIVTALGG